MKKTTDAEYQRKKAVYNDLMPIWEDERKIQLEAEARFNKNIFLLAAGSFGVSFAFINQIVPIENAKHHLILVVAWFLMGVTLLLNIIDSRVTFKIQDKLLDNIDANIDRGYEGKLYEVLDKNKIELPTRIFKNITLICFSVGIFCLLLFVLFNIVL